MLLTEQQHANGCMWCLIKKILKIKAVFSVIKLTLFLLQNQDNKNTRSSVGGPRCKIKKGSYLLFPTASDAGGYNLSEGGKVEPLLDCCMTSSASTGVQKTERPRRHWAPAHARLSLHLTICFPLIRWKLIPPRSHLGSTIMTQSNSFVLVD